MTVSQTTPSSTPPTASPVAADAFAAFSGLRKGDPAPGWLHLAVADGWQLDPDAMRTTLIAVSENATFRVDVDGAPYAVLRVHRPAYVDPHQIASELTWVQALAAGTDVAVPQVLPLADGSLVLPVTRNQHDDGSAADPRSEPWHVVAFAVIDGEVLEDISDPRPYYGRIGEVVAKFHNHSQAWQKPEGFDRFTWNIENMLGAASRWGDWRNAALTAEQLNVLEAAETKALEEVAPLVKSGEARGLIHADLRPSNIMATGDQLTVIDFDDCGWSWWHYDFAAAFSFIEHEPYAPDIAKDWIAGYSSVRPFDDADLRYACALSMIRRLQMLGWTTTHRQDALPAAIWAAQVPGTERVARDYLASSTWMLD